VTDFTRPYPIQFKGNWLASRVLKWLGWQVKFEGFPTLQGIAVVYPHTSNWDFPVMLMMKWAYGIPVMFWGKDSLFKWPLIGSWMRWLGGIPVKRTVAGGVVGQAVKIFEEHKQTGRYLWLGLSPEGTRKRIPGWRSGFYLTASKAKVPLCIVTLDYAKRQISAVDFMDLSGDQKQDMAQIEAICQGVKGLHPELASPIQLIDPKISRQDLVVK
jgi:1-acyl-sn-glycerol-3-phosphate acyltransferase